MYQVTCKECKAILHFEDGQEFALCPRCGSRKILDHLAWMKEFSPARNVFFGVLIALAVLFVGFVWPTPWRYENIGGGNNSALVKINRFTGDVEMVKPKGY